MAPSNFSVPGGRFLALLYFIIGFIVFFSGHSKQAWRELISSARDYHWKRILAPQLSAFFLIIYLSSKLYPNDLFAFNQEHSNYWIFWSVLLTATALITSFLSLLLIAPKAYWEHFFKTEKKTFLLALILPASHIAVYSLSMQSEDVLSKPTMIVAKAFLDLFYTDVRADLVNRTLETSNFGVIVDQMCSGYTGIGMIVVFLAWYLRTFKSRFRFPAVLLLIPIGATLVWLSNCLRVALIVVMGTSVSSEIASEGLHQNAGWIFFITIATGMVLISHNSRLFSRTAGGPPFSVDSTSALVIPFLLMLAATLLLSSLSAGFQWLYPIRAMATGLAIFLLWRHIRPESLAPSLFPVIAGIVVFVLWIMLIPASGEIDRKFDASLSGVSAIVSVGWIVFRLLGSVIIVPIAEELAFRGYLPALFHGNEAGRKVRWEAHLLPFLASSLLFGALHSALLAGTLAGAVYYLVKLRSGRLWDAVIAHMTTNLLLSAYVLMSGHWSYW